MRVDVVRKPVLFLVLVFAASALFADTIKNWPAPATWSPPRTHSGLSTQDLGNPTIFEGLAPCRVVDTRGNGAPITGGMFTGGSDVRNWALAGICGIPATARAVSVNFTAILPTAPGFLVAWPKGGAVPGVSILNFNTGDVVNNAAVVPVGTSTSITVNVSAPTHVTMDINGYYTGGNISGSIGDDEDLALIGNSAPDFCAIVYSQNDMSSNTFDCASAIMAELFGSASNGSAGNFVQHSTTTGGRTSGVRAFNESTAGSSVGIHAVSSAPTIGSPFGLFHSGGLIETANDGNALLIGANNGGLCINFGLYGGIFTTAGALVSGGSIGNCGGVGVSYVGGLGGSGPKSFFEPHPTDATKMIRYVSLEGPEAGTYFRGTARTVNGMATIEVPETFRIVTDDDGMTTQVTPVGAAATMYIVSEDLNHIVVHSSKDVTFHYLVQGVRRAYKNLPDVTDNYFFRPVSPTALMPGYSAIERQRLIDNGTYNADGTVNMNTAERTGWAAVWRAAAEEAARRELEPQEASTNRMH
jgi:hypothetical protein